MDSATVIGEVMGTVLGTGPLGPDDDFFARGGDSLRAIEVLTRLGSHPGTPEAHSGEAQAHLLESVFEDATPTGLVRALENVPAARVA